MRKFIFELTEDGANVCESLYIMAENRIDAHRQANNWLDRQGKPWKIYDVLTPETDPLSFLLMNV